MRSSVKTFLITVILLSLIVSVQVFAQSPEKRTGAAAKIPYPMLSQNVSLDKQKVRITVYSTFIEVKAEYQIKNNSKNEITATIGFPIYRHSLDISRGESPPIALKVLKGKDEDFYVKRKVEGEFSLNRDTSYKEWYMWDVDVGGNRRASFKVHYYMKLNRDNGIPHLAYSLKEARGYSGKVGHTEIVVDMPIDCEDLPFATKKHYSSSRYIYSSLPKPEIRGNLLTWTFDDHQPGKDLVLYFYSNGFPGWQVSCAKCQQEADKTGCDCQNVLDGNRLTYWKTGAVNKGVGYWLQFKPVNVDREGNTASAAGKIYQVGVIPGNTRTLSEFYKYSHLKEAEVKIYQKPKKEKKEKKGEGEEEKPPEVDRPRGLVSVQEIEKTKDRKDEKDVLLVDCTADPVLQVFKTGKFLDASRGPVRMLMTMVYPGQDFDQLCISEVLLFDRKPGRTFKQD